MGGLPSSPAGGTSSPRALRRELVAFVVLAGVAGLAVTLVPPDAQASTVRLAILVLGILAAWRTLGRSADVTASTAEQFEAELRDPPVVIPEIASLRSIDTSLRMSAVDTLWLEFRLKPLLRELAASRLAANHGVDIDASPDVARRILGEPLWRLSHPATERPETHAPRLRLADAQAAIDRLERI